MELPGGDAQYAENILAAISIHSAERCSSSFTRLSQGLRGVARAAEKNSVDNQVRIGYLGVERSAFSDQGAGCRVCLAIIGNFHGGGSPCGHLFRPLRDRFPSLNRFVFDERSPATGGPSAARRFRAAFAGWHCCGASLGMTFHRFARDDI